MHAKIQIFAIPKFFKCVPLRMHERKFNFLHGYNHPAPLNQKQAHSQQVSLAGIIMWKDLLWNDKTICPVYAFCLINSVGLTNCVATAKRFHIKHVKTEHAICYKACYIHITNLGKI